MKSKFWFLLAILMAGCLFLSGCLGGAPLGWSGSLVGDDALYVGTTEGKVVSYTLVSEPRPAAVEWWRYPPLGKPGLGGGVAGGFLSCAPTAAAGIYSTPFVVDGVVYIGAYDGRVYAFNSSSRIAGHSFPQESEGEWTYPREGEGYIGAIVGSPVVADGILYIGSADGKLYAIDIATGELAWDAPFASGDDIWATPLVYNGTVYFGSLDHKLYALDAETGGKEWEFPTGGAITAAPLICNETIYIGSFDRKFYAINLDGTPKWEKPFSAGNWFWGEAVAYGDNVIVGCLDGRVYALDTETGDSEWDYETGGAIRGDPALVGDVVIFGSEDGKVYALDATSGQGIWEYPRGDEYIGPIRASLYARDGVVYVHDTVNYGIYALDAEYGDKIWGPVSTSE